MENLEKLINEKFNTVNTKLDGIGGRLDKINGSVQKHEKNIGDALIERARNRQEQEDKYKIVDEMETRLDLVEKEEVKHYTNCPQAPLVRKLQDESLSNRSVKKFMFMMFSAGLALGGFVVAIIKLTAHINATP